MNVNTMCMIFAFMKKVQIKKFDNIFTSFDSLPLLCSNEYIHRLFFHLIPANSSVLNHDHDFDIHLFMGLVFDKNGTFIRENLNI